MLQQFNNEPSVITEMELGYLSLEDMISFMALPTEKLYSWDKDRRKGLTEQDKSKFRKTIYAELEQLLYTLRYYNVCLISKPDDEPYMILARTIDELQREKEIIPKWLSKYDCAEVTKEQFAEIDALNPGDSWQDLYRIDGYF